MTRGRAATPSVDPSAFVAYSAVLRGDVLVGPNAVIMFGAVARAEHDRIVIGAGSNVQDNAVLHCDDGLPCVVGERVTIGHAAVVHGATVGDNCLIGIGALVLNGAEVGEGAWVAAGSVLPEGKALPPWTLGVGAPAKPVRELTAAEIERQRSGIEIYRELGEHYRIAGDHVRVAARPSEGR